MAGVRSITMWYACSIAVHSYFESYPVQEPVELAGGIKIEPVPEWVKSDESLEHLSWLDRANIKDASLTFASEYEAEALGSPDPDWTGKAPRSIQDAIDEKFTLASVALWLVCPSPLSCGPTLHFSRKEDPASRRQSSSLSPILVSEDENNNVPSIADLERAGELLAPVLSLQRSGSTWIAIRILVRALTESMWEARYLWEWVVLEALFGPENPNETTYRLSQRIAWFLASSTEERQKMFDLTRRAYHWRSRIVHGGRISKLTPEKSQELTVFTESVLRNSLSKILGSVDLIEKFNGAARDVYLDSLALGNEPS